MTLLFLYCKIIKSSIETTENYYILSSKEAQKEANKILEDVIKSDIISKIIDYK